MFQTVRFALFWVGLLAIGNATAQSSYQVVSLRMRQPSLARSSGQVRYPASLVFPSTRTRRSAIPSLKKTRDLERLIVGPQGGVANTVVFLKRHFPWQSDGHPRTATLPGPEALPLRAPHLVSAREWPASDARALTPLCTQFTWMVQPPTICHSRSPTRSFPATMPTAGLANVRCNGGHAWMNAEILVVSHPYYAVTDESGKFELTDVPPGEYEIVAWHEGWKVLRQEAAFDVLTERRIQRPVFSEPKTWEKKVTVSANEKVAVNFFLSEN